MEFLCEKCNKLIPGITALGGECICDHNDCGTLDEDNNRTIRTLELKSLYIGDGVYCDFESQGIVLKANDHKNPTDTIWLGKDEIVTLYKILVQAGIL